MEKIYLNADQLLSDSFTLAAQVVDSGYRPTMVIGIWRGGCSIAIAVHEFLEVCGIHCDHIPVRTRSYSGHTINHREADVQIDCMEYLINNVSSNDELLIVDDVHDTGLSMAKLLGQINLLTTPKNIKIATAYFKPGKTKVPLTPDYYLYETDQWLVFPHELVGLSKHELTHHKPAIAPVIDTLIAHQ